MTAETLRIQLNDRLDDLSNRIVSLAEINSGSYNPDGVNRCGERLAEMVQELGPNKVESVPVDPMMVVGSDGVPVETAVGNALRATKRPDAPFKVCFFGHIDTVFPEDHPFQQVTVADRRLFGPGVADCKGGLVQALEVMRYLDTVAWGENIGWEFLVLPDEEVGSVGSKPLLEQASGADIGLGFEPALPSGGVAAARKGSLNVHTIVRGFAAHAGRAHHEGRSAILGLSNLIAELERHNERAGVTVNCGRISGGGPLNVVPDFAVGSYNLRVESADDQQWIEKQFEQAAADSSLDVDVVWTSARPPKLRTPELNQLLADVSESAEELGLSIPPEDTGGSCDGNDLAAAGLINVDSLGICGGAIHSAEEFADVDTIPGRAAVIANVIKRAWKRSLSEHPISQDEQQ